MVSTRQHPREFPPPPARASPAPSVSDEGTIRKWVHTPSVAVIIWLFFSIPLVAWDSGYVLLRPHSMPGHKLHSPIWTPYALYGTIDYIYGWPAFNARNGFTAAQTILNLFESAAYIYYLTIVYIYGVSLQPDHGREKTGLGRFVSMVTKDKVVSGRIGATALLVAYSASLMTLGKTILYCKPAYLGLLCCFLTENFFRAK